MQQRGLLVIDSSDQRRGYFQSLLSNEYDLIEVATGREGIELASMISNQLAAVLLNLQLSDMSGLSVLRELTSSGCVAPVICFHRDDALDLAVDCMRAGAFDFFSDPIDKDGLKLTVRRAIEDADIFSQIEHMVTEKLASGAAEQRQTRLKLAKEVMQKRLGDGDRMSRNELFSLLASVDELPPKFSEEFLKAAGVTDPLSDGQETLLIVEDEPIHRENLRLILGDSYELIFSEDCQSALMDAKAAGHVDVVLLDIMLPDGKGVKLIPELKALHPTCEVVMITGYEITDLAIQSFHNGAYDYINKPFRRSDLLFTISKALHRKYLKHALDFFGDAVIFAELSERTREEMAKREFRKRDLRDEVFTLSDLSRFFPEIREIASSKSMRITEEIVSDGLGVFIHSLLHS